MIFDQAFYTRRRETGLGVYASSKNDRAFKDYCSKIGNAFKKEDYNPDTAEFVYYSGDFGKFVGVGVSPMDSDDKTNKVVHIWVPESKSEDPSDYYLPYEFSSSYSLSEKYEQREFIACISEEDYPKILNNYKLSQDSLELLLYKAFLVMSGADNRLYIVFPEDMTDPEEKRTTAREIMWFLSMLIPVCGREKANWANKLSYSVFSYSNRGAVSVPFVEERPERGLYFTLCSEDQEQRVAAIPEVFHVLAEKAMDSLETYQAFINELSDYLPGDKKTDKIVLQNKYFYSKLRNGELTEVKEKELPIGYQELVKKAMNNPVYQDYLFRVLAASKELELRQLVGAHTNVLTDASKRYDPNSPDRTMTAAYKNMMECAYDRGFSGLYKNCLSKERISNIAFLKDVTAEIWREKGEESCIGRDIISVTDESIISEKLSDYSMLLEDDSFKQLVRKTLFDKDLYFDMNMKGRQEVSLQLDDGNGYFEERIKEKVSDLLRNDMNSGIEFLQKEMRKGCIEEKYAAAYFNSFVASCPDAPKEFHTRLQDTGHEFLTKYETAVDEEDRASFQLLDKTWKAKELEERFSKASLEYLADFSFDEFNPYKSEDRHIFALLWCDEVISRLGKSENGQELNVKPDFTTFKRIVNRKEDVKNYCPDRDGAFRGILWESCGSDMERRILCSNAFGVTNYSIWTTFMMDIGIFRQIAAQSNTKEITETKVDGNLKAELNRRCYRFWKFSYPSVQKIIEDRKELERFAVSGGLTNQWNDFCHQSMSELTKSGANCTKNELLEYIIFYSPMLEKWPSAKERCEDYLTKFNSQDAPFFDKMLVNLRGYSIGEKPYIQEMATVREVMKVNDVKEENLKSIKVLLSDAEKCFGEKNVKEEIPLMVQLYNQYNSEKERLFQSIDELESDLTTKMKEIADLEEAIEKLTAQKKECETSVERIETQILKKRQIQDSIIEKKDEKSNPLQQKASTKRQEAGTKKTRKKFSKPSASQY